MSKLIKLFVSYSWEVERQSKIVDELEAQCTIRNIQLIRDAKAMKQGDRISEFMTRIAEASHVITVFSQDYFQSQYCVYELQKVLQHKGLQQKIYPILANDEFSVNDPGTRRALIEYWKAKAAQEAAAQADLERGDAPSQDELVNRYKRYSLDIDGLMVQAGDILAAQSQELANKHFRSILDLISPVQQIPPEAIYKPSNSDEDFMSGIPSTLIKTLKGCTELHKALIDQLGANNGSEASVEGIASTLISQCLDAPDELLRDDVHGAVEVALEDLKSREDNDSHDVIKTVNKLTECSDQLFSNLLLYAINKDWMTEYNAGCRLAPSNLRDMPFSSVAAVEIVTSRHLQRPPKFRINETKSDVLGSEGGFAYLEDGFDGGDQVTGILRQLWKQVFPMESGDNLNERRLGNQIKTRHRRPARKKPNYYLIVPEDDNHPLMDIDVRNQLIQRLPEVPLIILKGDNGSEALLIADDDELATIILDFYLMLDEYRPYEPKQSDRRPQEN